MKKLLMMTAMVTTMAVPAYADQLLGIGYQKCLTITKQYDNSTSEMENQVTDLMVGSWLGGFGSATNIVALRHDNNAATKDLSGMSLADEILLVRRYCRAHPQDQVVDGVIDMISQLPTEH